MHQPLLALTASVAVAAIVVMAMSKPHGRRRNRKKLTSANASATRMVPRFSPLKSPADGISLLCWNTLSPAFARPKSLPWVSPATLAWPSRAALLAAELRATAADIIALQEVEGSRWSEMVGWLPGWCSLLQDTGGARDKGEESEKDRMLLALMWRPRLQLVWSESRSRALLAQFQFTDSQDQSRDLWVVNVHLEGSPYRPNDRVSQVKSALSRLAARQEAEGCNPATAHVIFCGDMNSGKGETVYRLLGRGMLEGGSTDSFLPSVEATRTTISHPFKLQDVHVTAGSPLPFTRKAPGNAATIDFIWASAHFEVPAIYDPLRGTRSPPTTKTTKTATTTSATTTTSTTTTTTTATIGQPAASTGQKSSTASQAGSSKGQKSNTAQQSANGNSQPSRALSPPTPPVTAPALTNTGRALAISCRGPNSGLPNALCPSDHLPLGVVLNFPPMVVLPRHVIEVQATCGQGNGVHADAPATPQGTHGASHAELHAATVQAGGVHADAAAMHIR